jgi:5-methylcytosine-specific restriction endonuclease McrA
MDNVILLNADYTPLGFITIRKAIKLLCKKKVEIVKASKHLIYNFEKTINFLIPEVLKLIKFVRSLWKTRVPFNKRNLLIRDNYTCQYCGKELKTDNSSIDHILPVSKGGKKSFENCTTACIPCNNKKDDRTCSEARMYPKNKPYTPTINQFLHIQIKNSGLDKTLQELGII